MSPSRKTHPPRRHRQTRRWLLPVIVVLLIITVSIAAYLSLPNAKSTSNNQSQPTTPPQSSAFTAFTEHYLAVMKNLNSTQTRAEMASMLNLRYNQTDLFAWEKTKMTFINGPDSTCEDPFQILQNKEGICIQWSIVYVSACLALGYQSRLVVAADTSSWTFIHVWAEDYYNGKWVHVDPSDAVWNDPARYQSWGWGTFGSQVKVYAFEDGTFQEVTSTYSAT